MSVVHARCQVALTLKWLRYLIQHPIYRIVGETSRFGSTSMVLPELVMVLQLSGLSVLATQTLSELAAVLVVTGSVGIMLVISGIGNATERRRRMLGSTVMVGEASVVLSLPEMLSQLPGFRVLVTQVLGVGRGAATTRPRRRVAGMRKNLASILTDVVIKEIRGQRSC